MYGKRRSIRLGGYDYSQEGLYFVTIDLESKKNLLWKEINIKGRREVDKIVQQKIN